MSCHYCPVSQVNVFQDFLISPQVNFFDDHTKLILSNVKGDYVVTYIDQERCARTYSLPRLQVEGSAPEILERMTFARSMLKNLVDIEGADI